MKYCQKCGQALSDEAAFCSKCGNSVESATPKEEPAKPDKINQPNKFDVKSNKRGGVIIALVVAVFMFFVGKNLIGPSLLDSDEESRTSDSESSLSIGKVAFERSKTYSKATNDGGTLYTTLYYYDEDTAKASANVIYKIKYTMYLSSALLTEQEKNEWKAEVDAANKNNNEADYEDNGTLVTVNITYDNLNMISNLNEFAASFNLPVTNGCLMIDDVVNSLVTDGYEYKYGY